MPVGQSPASAQRIEPVSRLGEKPHPPGKRATSRSPNKLRARPRTKTTIGRYTLLKPAAGGHVVMFAGWYPAPNAPPERRGPS
jgi:hypothetical protein